MNKSIIYGQDQRVWKWMQLMIPDLCDYSGGATIALEIDGALTAAVAFDSYDKVSIQMHIATLPRSNKWMTRANLYRVFAYPFIQLKVNRITGMVREDNLRAQRFNEHLGFKREGLVRHACADKTNMILYGMLPEECRFIGGM